MRRSSILVRHLPQCVIMEKTADGQEVKAFWRRAKEGLASLSI